ncbi:glycosyltransferase family 4 protein [Limosilactobacillus reuteri]|uniref:glycosyltransferase family 4 protein n=1 Tax=Limosilactobacillus reuteri TaxID=1598 RepID=UPI001E422F30|nr:glycosyltransferase family 4 protein [Limosilactobacillus reuteri]MCC4502876.1 glycosyltransferase family 4 protein [Limosilactobacillus reuteri]
MRINFVLPRTTNKPVGGYKIIYQYAKRLSKEGNDVHIYYLLFQGNILTTFLRKIEGQIFKDKYRKVDWFNLQGVKLHFDQTTENIINISDGKIIATHWSTADVVYRSNCKLANKFYLIQGYENFDPAVTEKKLDATWHLPLKKIVISKWLYKKGLELGINENDMSYVPNFIDTKEYPILEDERQDRKMISFLWHNNPQKQSSMGISVATALKTKFPNLEIVMFGANITDHPKNIKIINNASVNQLNNIYRHSLVYFMPSRLEGWGLTGMEAMACGAAVVSVDNGGIWEYANNKSAIIVKNKEKELLNAICSLITDSSKRDKLTSNAYREIKKLTLDEAYKKFLKVLNS